MNSKPSIAKKVASVAAGTALAASLYANAVYQPRNESALEQALDRELQAVVSGDAELTLVSDGFVVVERAPVAAQDTSKLVQEIAQLEAEMQSSSREATEKLAAVEKGSAYRSDKVVKVAQGGGGLGGGSGLGGSIPGIAGFSVGATIGSLATILSSPFITAAQVRTVVTTFSPAQVSQAASSTAGISAAGNILAAGIQSGDSAQTIIDNLATASVLGANTADTGSNAPTSP